MSPKEFFEYLRTFITIAFAVFVGCVLAIVATETEKPEPVIVNITIQVSDEKVPEVRVEPESYIPEVQRQEISEDFDIFQPCGYTAEELEYALSDNNHKEMLPYVGTLLEAENTYGVNAFYLMCKFGLESGWARYESGENNIGGWTNKDGSYKDFNSVEDCIMHISKNLSTRYKETVGSRLGDVCKRYCPNEGYSEMLMGIMKERKNKIENM